MAELDEDAKLEVRTTHEDSGVVFEVSGEIDLSTASQLREAIASAGDTSEIVFDLDAVTFMDSSGLSVLLEVAAGRTPMSVRSPSEMVRRVIETTGVSETLKLES